MEKESKLKKLDTKAWQIENGFMQYEVNKLKKEINVMQNEVFRLNKEKIIFKNNAESEEYIMKDMKKEIKWYKENINEMENDLKNMKSAFLLMDKQIKQTKFELTKHKRQNDAIGEELLYLLSKYGK
jgi:cob(I)alamin adenosyltransferase